MVQKVVVVVVIASLMILLEPDRLVSFVAGVEREERKGDDDVPNVGSASLDRHRVLVVPFVGETGTASEDALGGLVPATDPGREIDQTNLAEGRVQRGVVAPGDKRPVDAVVVVFGVIAQRLYGTHYVDVTRLIGRKLDNSFWKLDICGGGRKKNRVNESFL